MVCYNLDTIGQFFIPYNHQTNISMDFGRILGVGSISQCTKGTTGKSAR